MLSAQLSLLPLPLSPIKQYTQRHSILSVQLKTIQVFWKQKKKKLNFKESVSQIPSGFYFILG